MYKHFIIAVLLSNLTMVDASEQLVRGVDFQQNAAELRLRVNQALLPVVLQTISDKTSVAIHYSVLPEAPVSATCIGESVKAVLKCLLGDSVDMAFRYPEGGEDKQARQPLEVWLLGSSLTLTETAGCGGNESRPGLVPERSRRVENPPSEPDPEQKLAFRKQMAVSGNPLDRAQALSYLTVHAPDDDEDFQAILDNALTDANGEVRGQAIAALVRRQGEQAAFTQLQQALLDDDVSVRLMALQQVNETAALIQQALSDQDESVRNFAAMKLQSE